MKPTTPATIDLPKALTDGLKQLRILRDEIRVDVHLAGMEAKTRWEALEPQVEQAEKLAHDITEASRKAIQETVTAFHNYKGWLAQHGKGTAAKP